MRERPTPKFRPGLEPLEAKRTLSVGATTPHVAPPAAADGAPAPGPAEAPTAPGAGRHGAAHAVSIAAVKPKFGYLVYRLTNPNRFNNKLIPPFSHVLVQTHQPVPGRVYNILYVAVRNGSARTFTAADGLGVRFPGQPAFLPILSGNDQWKPGQEFVFYVLTKKYYPLPNQVTSGFQFNLGGAKSTAIPGPSGIFLRVKYNPATFGRTLDWIVAFGPGAQGGSGVRVGIPDTAIYEFASALAHRNDFGGYF